MVIILIDTNQLLKEAKEYYAIFSKPIKLGCPFCKYSTTHKTKTYHSLKSVSWHVVNSHQNEIDYPFSVEQIREILKAIGVAIHWGILV